MKDTVSTSKGGAKYKKMNLIANMMFISIICGFVGYEQYDEFRKEQLYDALNIAFTETKVLEYGTDNYDAINFVAKQENGVISNYTKEVDTSVVGVHKLKYEITKDDVSKEILIEVEVKDTKKPIIKFKKDTITLYVGNTYAYKNNIQSIKDEVDGDISYVDKAPEINENGYYTITSNFVKNKIGTYKVTVKAVDKNNNETVSSYNIKVIAKPKPKVQQVKNTNLSATIAKGNYSGPATVDTSSVVNAAKSLVGSKYVYAASNPKVGFDCSGLVSYVYRLFGKNLSRTARGIASEGKAVSESNMQPGDIIIWSHRKDNVPTHVAIYIGNGTMVHAANKRLGVVSMSVSYWKNGGRNKIVSVRRV